MAGWFTETFADRLRLGLKVTRSLFEGRSEHQEIAVFETPAFGRVLAIDGVLMTSERDEHF